MQGSRIEFDCALVAAEESEMQGSKTGFLFNSVPVAGEDSKPRERKGFTCGRTPWKVYGCEKRTLEEFEREKKAFEEFIALTHPHLGWKPKTEKETQEAYERRYSQVAITYYNANNPGAEIELVEAGPPNLVFDPSVWLHLNFKARPKNSDSLDPVPKLYFAEIQPRVDENHVTIVCVVDRHDYGSTVNGCGVCDPTIPFKYRIYHPRDGKFTAGRFMLWQLSSNQAYLVGPNPSTFQTPRESIGCKRPWEGFRCEETVLEESELQKLRRFVDGCNSNRGSIPVTEMETQESFELRCSQVAIAYYNANNPGAEIELVEAGPPSVVFNSGMWYHLNFKARPKNSDSPDPSPKLYFAEIRPPKEKGNHVTTVCVVDPLDSGSTIKGCGFCKATNPIKYLIYHPKDGQWTVGRLPRYM